MTWSPLWWLLPLVPALVALYFLKLRRRDVVVSSTLLWRRSLEQFRVNAPFQRLRRNWLLVLQLLALGGLILAAWNPRIEGRRAASRDLILLVDRSASSSARRGGETQLDVEKREAAKLIGGLRDADTVTLIAFASHPVALAHATSDHALAEARLAALRPTDEPTDLARALVVAAGVAEGLGSPEVHVLGDGCYGDLATLPPEAKRVRIELAARGEALDNRGITEIDARKSFDAEGRTELFALVENAGETAATVRVALEVEGDLRDARELEIPAGEDAPVTFDVTEWPGAMATVSIDPGDALAADDRAWVAVPASGRVSVLVVGDPNPWIDLALDAAADVRRRRISPGTLRGLLEAKDGAREDPGALLDADVLLFDREAPAVDPPLPALYFGCAPALPEGFPPPSRAERPTIVDWDRAHPLLRFIVFADVRIEESLAFGSHEGYASLVDSDAGSIAGTLRYWPPGRRSVPAILVGFDVLKSNWPVGHRSYPIFVANAVRWLATGGEERLPARWRTGAPLAFRPPRGGTGVDLSGAFFRGPSGTEVPARLEPDGSLTCGAADEAGVWTLVAGGRVAARFGVSLLDAAESRIRPSAEVDFGDYRVSVAATSGPQARELWRWLALAALAFLALEWLVYHRRLAARGLFAPRGAKKPG